jgi:O-antigen/teichoic acid export membrane protein
MYDRAVHGWQPWARWDYNYCGKFVAATLFANQLGAADIVVASLLFSSTTVADYAVAARLAALFTFFELALLKRFAPRAGRLLQTRDAGGLAREFDMCRRLAIGCVALTVAAVLPLAPVLLPVLGNYMSARSLLIWLAIPSFVMSFYAAADRLLIIAGQANVALTVTASSFAALVATPFAIAPWLGPVAIPAAMILSVALFNPLVALRANQLVGVRTFAWRDVALLACGCLALVAAAAAGSYASTAIACAMLGAIGAYYLATAMSRSVGDRYGSSPILAASVSQPGRPLLSPEKASR